MLIRLTTLTAILVAVTITAPAQGECGISAAQAPTLAGFRLGMTYQDIQRTLAPAIKVKPKKTGEGTVFESFAEREPPSQMAGIQAFWLRLFNNKVYQIEIFYADPHGQEKIEDLIGKLSSQINVPADAWAIKHGRAELDCGGFSLKADMILSPHIELTDDAAYKEFQEKQKQKKSGKKN